MLQMKEKLLGLWHKIKATAKKTAEQANVLLHNAVRFMAKHRISTCALCGVMILSMLMSVITVNIHEVTVLEDGAEINRFHAILTDEESLMEKAAITLFEGDEMSIVEDGGLVTISIARAFPISIKADGKTITVLLASGTVADALKKAGLTCGKADLLNHKLTTPLTKKMTIKLDRVTTGQVVERQSIEFETKKIETNDLYVGQTKVQQAGVKGEKTFTYDVTYVNGKESSRKLVKETTKDPVDEIILVGIKVKSSFKRTASTPSNYKRVVAMTATAYVEGGYTASGRPARVGVVAVDPRVIPLGTKVYVETADGGYIYGTAIAADTGGAIKGNKIDLCVHSYREAIRFGRRTVNVYIL